MSPLFVICALLVSEASSAVIFDPPPSNSTVLEGGTSSFTCAPNGSAFINWVIDLVDLVSVTVLSGNSTTLPGADQVILSANRTQLTITGVQRSLDGASVQCRAVSASEQVFTPLVYIVVQRPPNFTLPELSRDVLEGQALSLTLENVDFGNSEGAVSVLFEGRVLTEGNGFNVSRSGSTWSLEFPTLNRSDAGVYRVLLKNTVGSSGMNCTVNVVYPPEFTFPTVRSVQLNSGSLFTFDCRASAANPSSVDYSFHVNGSSQPFAISGPVLTISSVVRANTGNYSCTANNTAGSSVTVYHNLLVVAPPTSPLNLMVSGEIAFSAIVTWTPPTDDGGISHPSWTPPSPSSSPIVQYIVTYSNSSGSWSINNLNTPLVAVTNLQHSTDYTVTVAASNAHGQSTAVQRAFRTSDSKPVLQAAVFSPLSLNNFTANLTFLTVGGKNVTNFSITINDSSPTVVDSTSVPDDGKGVMVSLLIEGRSFTKGTYYSVKITAANSVGTSEPITGLLFVPNPPMITANFTEVFAGDIPSTKCCAGVQLRLAEQPDVSDLKVLLTPQGGNQFTVNPAELSLEGFTLYIGGLQTGTDYTAVVTVSNIFGSSDDQLQLKPLLGVPSNPNPPTVSVNGGQITVELSTAYPGTVQTRSGSMFRFEVQFIKASQRSSRQSKTEMQAVTPASLSNTSATLTTNLDPGSYSVSVTAVNEHGRSSAVMSESTFSVEAPTGDVTITIIIAIVVVVVLVLIVLIIAIICTICCLRVKKNRGTAKLGGKKSQTEPVYDIIETDLHAGTSVEMHSNPAYGTAESVTTTDKPIPGHVGPEYETVDSTAVGDSDVVLLENMAYGVIGDVKLPPTTTITPSVIPPTQCTPGGLGSEYEVMDMKKEVRKKATDVEGHYSNFSML